MKTYAEMVRAGIMERQPNVNGPAVGQVGFLRRELAKQRRHAPLRKLFEQAGGVIVGCTPCLLMSPLSVATYLPKDSVHFDVVIFDEASQMPAEDAAGAILRGKQLIVAGDPKQLPPTRFFQRALEEEGDYAEELEPLESVLDDCRAASMQRCPLEWHYRSRHESLIAFSNAAFFVKPLETVQGDERDSIIITVGFGRDATGNLALNFGPVNLEGGERRLNVAFTRARWELILIASIQAHDIDESRVQKSGPRVLKRYLAFAKEGCLPPETAAPTGESESPFE